MTEIETVEDILTVERHIKELKAERLQLRVNALFEYLFVTDVKTHRAKQVIRIGFWARRPMGCTIKNELKILVALGKLYEIGRQRDVTHPPENQ